MGLLPRVSGALFALALCAQGCSGDDPPPRKPRVFVPKNPGRSLRPKKPSYFDKDGHLKESDRELAGLVLPVGMESTSKDKYLERFKVPAQIPFEKLVAYFGPRLFTGKVDAAPRLVQYYRAVPQRKLDSTTKLDVRIMKGDDGYHRVHIRQYPKLIKEPLSHDEAREKMAEYFKSLE